MVKQLFYEYSQCTSAQLNSDFPSFIFFNIKFIMESNSAQVIAMTSLESFVSLVMTKSVVDNVVISDHTIIARYEVRMSNCFHYFNVYPTFC